MQQDEMTSPLGGGLIGKLEQVFAISEGIYSGEKPNCEDDLLIPLQICKMREEGFIPDDPEIYMIVDEGNLSFSESHDTKSHAVGYDQVKLYQEMNALFAEIGRKAHIPGENFLTRNFDDLNGELSLDLPRLFVPGDFYDMGAQAYMLWEATQGQVFENPQIIYNPDGYWDSLYEFLGQGGDFRPESYHDQNVFIVSTKEELKNILRFRGAEFDATFEGAEAPVTVLPGSTIAHASNNGAKRNKTLGQMLEQRMEVYPLSMQNILGPVMDQEEDGGTGNANARRKTRGAIDKLVDAKGSGLLDQELTKLGYDPDKFWGLTNDVIIEFLQPGLEDRPELAEYKTELRPGQMFPGSEMAYVAKVHGLETLGTDINHAFDNMEAEGKDVDRRVRVRTSIELFRAEEPKGDGRSVIYTAFGEQTYDFLPQFQPASSNVCDLEDLIAFQGQTESVGSIQRKTGLHPDTHDGKAIHAIAHIADIPKQEVGAPALLLRSDEKEKIILTDRHFTGTWEPEMLRDEFAHRVSGMRGQYRIPDQDDYQAHNYALDWTRFTSQADGIIILPRTGIETPQQLAMRAMLEVSWSVGQQLMEAHVAGKPRVQMDDELVKAKALLVRTERDSVSPEASYSRLQKHGTLADALNAGWNLHDYNPHPFVPDVSSSVAIPRSPSGRAAALVGSAKTRNPDVLFKSLYMAFRAHEKGLDVRHGLGADGSMIEFIRGGIEAEKAGYDAHQVGVTCPMAFIEGDPEEYRKQKNWPKAVVSTMPQRVTGIINEDAKSVNAIGGGAGTGQEILYPLIENIMGRGNRIITVDDEPLRLTNSWERAWSPVLEKLMPGVDLDQYGLHYVDDPDQAIEMSVAHCDMLDEQEDQAYHNDNRAPGHNL